MTRRDPKQDPGSMPCWFSLFLMVVAVYSGTFILAPFLAEVITK